MKKKIIKLMLGAFLLNVAFASETISVVATKFPNGDVLKVVEPILKKQGYNLEIREIPSYSGHGIVTVKGKNPTDEINNPNQLVVSGKADANFFQPEIYLDEYNRLSGTNLASVGKVFYVPFAIYISQEQKVNHKESVYQFVKSHNELTVGIPTGYIDAARALKLLESNKVISLDPQEKIPNLASVISNPYHLNIVQVDNEILPKLLQKDDIDMIVMNSGRAYLKGLLATDQSLMENNPEAYSNIVVTTKHNVNSPKIKALVEALNSESVRKYIEQNYKGIVKPSF